MSFFEAIILGIVEGITEFLPISSTAHLMMTSRLLAIEQTEFVKSFEVVIQLGAIAAVIFLFAPRLVRELGLWKKVTIAFIPTAVIGFLFYKLIKTYLIGNITVALLALIIGGIALIFVERYVAKKPQKEDSEVDHITNTQAFFIGLLQTLAVIPGVSRSATTIVSSMLFGANRKAATEFSFLLAIPTIAAAAGYDLIKNVHILNEARPILIVGFVVSFISAFISVKFLLTYIQRNSFESFGVYRILIAIAFFIYIYLRNPIS